MSHDSYREPVTFEYELVSFDSHRPAEDRFTLTLMYAAPTPDNRPAVLTEVLLTFRTRRAANEFCQEHGLEALFPPHAPELDAAPALSELPDMRALGGIIVHKERK